MHKCMESMKKLLSEKNQLMSKIKQERDQYQELNVNLADVLAKEKNNNKELIKSKGRICNFCCKPIKQSAQSEEKKWSLFSNQNSEDIA